MSAFRGRVVRIPVGAPAYVERVDVPDMLAFLRAAVGGHIEVDDHHLFYDRTRAISLWERDGGRGPAAITASDARTGRMVGMTPAEARKWLAWANRHRANPKA